MRLHITLDEQLVARLDARVGARKRSSFIAESVRQALDDETRWDGLISALDSPDNSANQWDDDPAEWVRRQRRADPDRVG